MSKDMDNIFIKLIENLDAKMTNLTTDISKTHTDLALIQQTLTRVEGQTMKTNGRVTKLEDVTVKLSESNIKLTDVVSKQNGIYEQNLLDIKDKINTRGDELDEIKKKVYTQEVLDTSNTQLETVKITENSKVKIAIWGGTFTVVGSLITFLITFYSK